ncbi:class I SAM-dependent methyltransferase [Vibrio diabolicus]|uniref:class I SAM-dependent methyltransferase n=1 Tax=Vibrio diabolicus TaxID=50719 RepID=UPI00280FC8F1|nr:class I SAM-dependent methyltransferase [Vibrio diabolicus]
MRKNKDDDIDWINYLNSFSETYEERVYKNLTGKIMNLGHCSCESKFSKSEHFEKVLEVGAGLGEHVKSVNHTFREYIITDSDSKNLSLAKEILGTENDKGKLCYIVENANQLRFEDETFDRLIATHILEHLYEPHLAIKEWKRVLKYEGVISIIIPTDPGIAWRLGRYLTTRKEALNKGWEYDYIMAREHVNPCHNLIAFLNYYFPKNNSYFWPFKLIPSIDCNLFYIFHAKK